MLLVASNLSLPICNDDVSQKRRNGKIKLKKNNKIIEKRFDHTLGIFANKFDCACANNEIFPVLRKVLTEVPIRQNQSAEQLRNTYI